MSEFAQVGDICSNPGCCDYGERQSGNIIKFGKTKAGRQRYRCHSCDGTFTETTGTIFFRKRTPEQEIMEALVLIVEGSRVSSVARVKWSLNNSTENRSPETHHTYGLAVVAAEILLISGAEIRLCGCVYAVWFDVLLGDNLSSWRPEPMTDPRPVSIAQRGTTLHSSIAGYIRTIADISTKGAEVVLNSGLSQGLLEFALRNSPVSPLAARIP